MYLDASKRVSVITHITGFCLIQVLSFEFLN